MVYTKKSPALLVIGLIMLAIWYTADSGLLAGYIEHLAHGKKYSYLSELTTIPLYFGVTASVIGLWQLLSTPKEGHQRDLHHIELSGAKIHVSQFQNKMATAHQPRRQ